MGSNLCYCYIIWHPCPSKPKSGQGVRKEYERFKFTAVSENIETNFLFCQRRKFWWLLRIARSGVAEPNRGQPKRQNLSLRSVLPSRPSHQPMRLPSALLQLDFPGKAHWDRTLCGCRRIFGRWQMSKFVSMFSETAVTSVPSAILVLFRSVQFPDLLHNSPNCMQLKAEDSPKSKCCALQSASSSWSLVDRPYSNWGPNLGSNIII
jgi:hypothetical protein